MELAPHWFSRPPSRRTNSGPLPQHPLTLVVKRSLGTVTPERRLQEGLDVDTVARPLRKTGANIFIRRAKSVMMLTELHNDASKKVDDASSAAVVGLTLVKAVLSPELLAI